MTLTNLSCSANDVIVIDDVKIERHRSFVLDYDFENEVVGEVAGDALSYVWNHSMPTCEVREENDNKYLYNYVASSGAQAWNNFYFNRLPLVSGVSYRLSFDILEHNFEEFYICYPEAQTPCATYSPTQYLYKDSNAQYIIGGSFDGTHLTFNFTSCPTS